MTKASANVPNKEAVATALISLADAADLFHDSASIPYVTFDENGHRETWPIESSVFRGWLTKQYFESVGKVPPGHQLKSAIEVLAARALFDAPELRTHLRVAREGDAIYVDIGDGDWNCVQIDSSGWRVVPHGDVKFRRQNGMLSIPNPEQGGHLRDLRDELPPMSDSDWVLVQGFLIDAFRSEGSRLVMSVGGGQGSGKSVMCETLVGLIDPQVGARGSMPTGERDLAIVANAKYVVCFDNVSGISVKMSDCLCRLSTGSGFSTRALFTNDGLITFALSRPVILNGIGNLSNRPDLDERTIRIELGAIAKGARKTEAEMRRKLEMAKPKILGAIFSAVSEALANEGSVTVTELPRMADTASWVVSAEKSMDCSKGDFLKALADNAIAKKQDAIDNDLLAQALVNVATKACGSGKTQYECSTSELLDQLKQDGLDESAIPESPEKLSNYLSRMAPVLLAKNVRIERGERSANRRPWIFSITDGGHDGTEAA